MQGMHSILLVDDEPEFLTWLSALLEEQGHEVRTAENIHDAKEALAASRPDLVVVGLFIQQPDDGFSLCYQIKKQDDTIPIILVTRVTSETGFDFEAATASERAWIKADAMLDRPFRFEQLQREMRRLLTDGGGTRPEVT